MSAKVPHDRGDMLQPCCSHFGSDVRKLTSVITIKCRTEASEIAKILALALPTTHIAICVHEPQRPHNAITQLLFIFAQLQRRLKPSVTQQYRNYLKEQSRLRTTVFDTTTPLHQYRTNRGNTVAMAMTKRSSSSMSSNSSIHSYSSASNVRASCYSVNAATASLHGFHYSTTPSAGAGWCS